MNRLIEDFVSEIKEITGYDFGAAEANGTIVSSTSEKLAENAGCSVLFLPPYSPDLNPIENLWANLKKFLKHYLRFFISLSAVICAFFILFNYI